MRPWYLDIFEALAADGVEYVVAGGIAVNLHGVPRFTADLDLIIALDQRNALRFVACMTRLGFRPKVPVSPEAFADERNRRRWIDEKNMRVFSFIRPDKPLELVDVFVDEPIPFEELWGKREEIHMAGTDVPIASIDHLIALKQAAGRSQDRSDIEALEKLKEELADDEGR